MHYVLCLLSQFTLGHNNQGKMFSTAYSPNKSTSRKIGLIPERVLDAPNYIDDYCKFFLYTLLHLGCLCIWFTPTYAPLWWDSCRTFFKLFSMVF